MIDGASYTESQFNGAILGVRSEVMQVARYWRAKALRYRLIRATAKGERERTQDEEARAAKPPRRQPSPYKQVAFSS